MTRRPDRTHLKIVKGLIQEMPQASQQKSSSLSKDTVSSWVCILIRLA